MRRRTSEAADSPVLGIIIAAAPRFAPQPPSPYAPEGWGGSIGFYCARRHFAKLTRADWQNPGPMVQYDGIQGELGRFLGFFAVLIQAAYSYIGVEIVAITAGEAENPRKTMPSAVKWTYLRILFFYVAGTFVLGMICPSNEASLRLASSTAKSPWVIVRNVDV